VWTGVDRVPGVDRGQGWTVDWGGLWTGVDRGLGCAWRRGV
jgi:hypothetical protein